MMFFITRYIDHESKYLTSDEMMILIEYHYYMVNTVWLWYKYRTLNDILGRSIENQYFL